MRAFSAPCHPTPLVLIPESPPYDPTGYLGPFDAPPNYARAHILPARSLLPLFDFPPGTLPPSPPCHPPSPP